MSSSSANEQFANLRIPLKDIVSATNNFADENLIKQGRTSNVYKGKLFWLGEWTDVAVRSVLAQHRLSQDKFVEEIKALSGLNIDKNLISIVGFCDKNGENIIVMEYAAKGRLDQYLSDPTTLTWSQRLKICLGVTRGFNRMTYKVSNYPCCTYSYRDIRSSKILLDKDWEAKISFFGLAKNKYGDMVDYPLGLIFLQLVYGRKLAVDEFVAAMADDHDQHMSVLKEKLKFDEFIDLSKQIHPLSFTIFLQIAYDCLTAGVRLRDNSQETTNRVEDALKIQLMHENIEKNMTHLKIRLNDIEVATENFSERYLVYSDTYEKLYKAELGPIGSQSSSTLEGCELFERQFIVAIQCISYDKMRGAEWFFEGFKMLASCKHPNIVSLLGYSWEGSRMILVFENPVKGSLCDYLRTANIHDRLTWKQRVQISIGIAHGLDCIRNMEDKLLLIKHRGITSSSIFLDDKWNAKIAGFKLGEGHLHPCKYIYREGSFIYSFGILLFEILFGRLVKTRVKLAEDVKYLTMEVIIKILLDDEPHDQREMVDHQDFLNAFSKIAYQCINVAESHDQANHLTIEFIIKELQKASELAPLGHLERLKIPLSEIKLATKDFNINYKIGSGAYGEVYKAELNIFDRNHSLGFESINEHNLPRRRKIVAIKRIFKRVDAQGQDGFLMELKVLSRCEHPNIVSLLGYCDDDSEMILAYEHVANGSLDDYLRSTYNKNKFMWSQRIKMCLDIAYGIEYLHSTTDNKECIIHRDIKSDNILLGDNWETKVADFGLSKVHPTNQFASAIITNNIAGTPIYMDPTYERHRTLKRESDIYSFGVVLFEIVSGKLAYDSAYTSKDTKGIAPIAKKHFKEGKLKEMVDPEIMKEAHEVLSIKKIGPSQVSLDKFLEIAHKCLAKVQDKRPTIKDIIKELQIALSYQEYHIKILKFSLEDIKLCTKNFKDERCIEIGDYWELYQGKIQHDNIRKPVLIKRLSKSCPKDVFLTELEILYKHKHKNIVDVAGYCVENDEKIIVLEAGKGSLEVYMYNKNFKLRWIERLNICIDIAIGLQFLHEGVATGETVVHRDIKSSSILLDNYYKAKISDFGLSLISKSKEYVIDHFIGTPGYCEYPLNMEMRFLSKESDIYSFGVVLFEILSGKLTLKNYKAEHCYLDASVKQHFIEGKLDELVYRGIKEEIDPLSLATFQKIAYQCLHPSRQKRPTAGEVVQQLRKALEIQEMESESPSIDCSKSKKEIMFPTEIPLEDGKVWLVSAMQFSYKNHCSHRWRSFPDSRFQNIAEMSDSSNLMIEIETKTQKFSGDYGVYLIFKFRDSRKVSSDQPMYVNLKYKWGSETLHAYFATRRDDEWMMIELYRILNHKKGAAVYKVLLESFSPCYCGNDVIYIEGIEFRDIDNVNQLSRSNMIVNQVQQSSNSRRMLRRAWNHVKVHKETWMSQVNAKKQLMLSAKEVLLSFPNVNLFASKPSIQYRFDEEEIELLPQQVFYINCTFKSKILSQDAEYMCYLVFKISERCHGLHCPVQVRDLLQTKQKEAGIIYFMSPSSWNIHAITQVPEKREDGWMEVNVWKFNLPREVRNDCVDVNLKLMSYEETMFGLIIRGVELRPM